MDSILYRIGREEGIRPQITRLRPDLLERVGTFVVAQEARPDKTLDFKRFHFPAARSNASRVEYSG